MLGLSLAVNSPAVLRRSVGSSKLLVPSSAKWIVEGDSIAAQLDGRSMAMWFSALSNGKVTFLPNSTPGTEATGGHTLANVLADAPGVLAEFPTLTNILIHAGRNSLTAGLATMQSEATQIIDAYNAAGVHVTWSAVLKATDAVGIANEATRLAFNAWLAGLTGKALKVINHDAVFDPATAPALVQADSLHPTVMGERIVVANIVAAMNFAASSHLSLMPGANVVPNAAFAGNPSFTTGFTADSVVPTGWTISNGSGATVKASVLDIGGIRTVEFMGSGSASSAASDLRLSRNVTELAALVGQWIEGGMFVEISNAAGNGDAVGLTGWMVTTGDGYAFNKTHNAAAYGAMSGQYSGFVRVPPVKETADSTFQALGFYCRLAVGAVDFRIRLWSPYGCVTS